MSDMVFSLFSYGRYFLGVSLLYSVPVMAQDMNIPQERMTDIIPPLPLKPFTGKSPLTLSCKDMLTGALNESPPDKDGNLIYTMTYTFCIQELVLKTFLEYNEVNHLKIEPALVKELKQAISRVSKLVYALLWASQSVKMAFTQGELRQKLNQEQNFSQHQGNPFTSYSEE